MNTRTEKSTSRGIRFHNSMWDEIAEAAEQNGMQPADFVRQACQDKLSGGVESKLDELENRLTDRMTQNYQNTLKVLGILARDVEWTVERLKNIKKKPTTSTTTK
jgi:hypothetical protein